MMKTDYDFHTQGRTYNEKKKKKLLKKIYKLV